MSNSWIGSWLLVGCTLGIGCSPAGSGPVKTEDGKSAAASDADSLTVIDVLLIPDETLLVQAAAKQLWSLPTADNR
jgi:hypothetical protein